MNLSTALVKLAKQRGRIGSLTAQVHVARMGRLGEAVLRQEAVAARDEALRDLAEVMLERDVWEAYAHGLERELSDQLPRGWHPSDGAS